MSNEMVCAECKVPFQGSDEGVSPIRHCPICVEAMQERMLNAIFGEKKGKSSRHTPCQSVCVSSSYARFKRNN